MSFLPPLRIYHDVVYTSWVSTFRIAPRILHPFVKSKWITIYASDSFPSFSFSLLRLSSFIFAFRFWFIILNYWRKSRITWKIRIHYPYYCTIIGTCLIKDIPSSGRSSFRRTAVVISRNRRERLYHFSALAWSKHTQFLILSIDSNFFVSCPRWHVSLYGLSLILWSEYLQFIW